MNYDIFMRTRTYSGDYDWINRPPYMPADIYKTCQSLIALREKQNFDHLTENDWYGNFFFIRAGGCAMLARMAKTKYVDSFGRSIFSFEGVCVRAEHEKRFFMDIPNLINAMLPPSKSFRTMFEEEEKALSGTYEVNSEINPLKDTPVDDMELHPDLKGNEALKNLINLISNSGTPEGFIFGRDAREFSSFINKSAMGIKHIFDFYEPDKIAVVENSYKPITCDYIEPKPTGTDKTALYLYIQERGKDTYKYCWQIRKLETDERAVKFTTKTYDITDRLLLSTLELQKESIKGFLTDSGWKKQEFGLRFEKDTYTRKEE
ncbi:MAG: hypothetical protein FWD34_09765 [Oscillospiraceae bacterium]|nr:hypothetical protein [Oscillospiraceae bacterium]